MLLTIPTAVTSPWTDWNRLFGPAGRGHDCRRGPGRVAPPAPSCAAPTGTSPPGSSSRSSPSSCYPTLCRTMPPPKEPLVLASVCHQARTTLLHPAPQKVAGSRHRSRAPGNLLEIVLSFGLAAALTRHRGTTHRGQRGNRNPVAHLVLLFLLLGLIA